MASLIANVREHNLSAINPCFNATVRLSGMFERKSTIDGDLQFTQIVEVYQLTKIVT